MTELRIDAHGNTVWQVSDRVLSEFMLSRAPVQVDMNAPAPDHFIALMRGARLAVELGMVRATPRIARSARCQRPRRRL